MMQGIVLAGPTASGKTAVALALAAQRPVEVISVDSALVYRGMDIGTAKPTAAERASVPHHLIDIRDPTAPYSAAQFAADAQRLAAEIRARGRLPLLVGGTMLYVKALREGIDAMPSADPAVRAALDRRAAAEGWPALHTELAHVDPVTAARLAPHDSQRIQRALEVWQVSGRALSQWQLGSPGAHDGTRAAASAAHTEWPLVSLEPSSRAWLHARIAERFDAMLAAGLIDEVRALRARGDLHAALPSMRCVGYRQVWAALEAGGLSPPSPPSLLSPPTSCPSAAWSALREAGIAATRQLAKRQLTWLRSMNDRHVLPCDTANALPNALSMLHTLADR